MTHLSLFSGIGGLDIAAHWAGFRTIQFVERDPFCQKVLAKNFPGVPIHDDITTFNAGRYAGVTIVSAGFPCQPHSVAGKRKASGDERDLWGETARILGEARPRWFVGENVPGLLSSESGRFFGRVVDDLAALGYRVGWCVYGAADVGACHRRHRIFIVGYADRQRLQELHNGISTGERNVDGGFIADSYDRHVDADNTVRTRGNPVGAGSSVSNPSGRILSREPRRGSGSFLEDGYRELPSRDWRSWPIKPVVRRGDDGIPGFMVRHRINILKALGNSVCPQQAYQVFRAIAEETA